METIIELLLPIIAALVAAGLGALLAWVAAKFQLDIPPEILTSVTAFARRAIMSVEEQAKSAGNTWSGKMKMDAVLQRLDFYAAQHPEAKGYIKKKARQLTESLLRSDLTPDEVTPK